MGELLRRRAMMRQEKSENWQPITSKALTTWSRASRVTVSGDSILFSPNSLDWNFTLQMNGLKYKWGQVKDKKFRIIMDFTISGINGTSARFSPTVALFNTTNPSTSTTRYGYFDLSWGTGTVVSPFGENGTHHFEYEGPFKTMSGTVNDNYYVGIKFYAYTGSGSTVLLSNVVAEILDE